MSLKHALSLASLLVGIGLAAATGKASKVLFQPYYPSNADCWEYKIPVTVTSENLVFEFPEWTDDLSLQDFLTAATIRASANYPSVITGTKNETDTYTIAASFCTPRRRDRKRTILLATHGIGQARTHWNSPYEPDKYNFVQHALSQGYSVWFYDRLGNGESSKPSGFKNQLRIQKAILVELSKIVKSGEYNGDFGKPKRLALLGFSFGSFVTHFAVAENPTIADAVVLTGINYNLTGLNANGLVRSFVPRVASIQNPRRFGALDPGYLTWADNVAQINTYFKFGFYDYPTTTFAEENKQAFTFGEFMTITDGEFDASGFTGSALALTGKTDYIICDGECEGIFEEPARTIWSGAKKFTPYLHPNSSHNINFHHNATGAYQVITDFLTTNL